MGKLENREVRFERVIQIVNERKKITTKELSELIGVSEMTVRRDLDILQKSGALRRLHGFAASLNNTSDNRMNSLEEFSYDLRYASIQHLKEIEKIAKYAASLIRPDDWIFMDNGTTTARIPSFLPNEIEFTVLCSNFALMEGLLKFSNIELVMSGGYYNKIDQTFTSDQSQTFIRTLRAKKAFLSASGVHESLGITCINAHSVGNKRAFIESAAQRILLLDSSKFGVVTANYFAEFNEIDMVITDSGITPKWIKILENHNIDVRIA